MRTADALVTSLLGAEWHGNYAAIELTVEAMAEQDEQPGRDALDRPTFTAEGLEETRRRMFGRNPWYARILLEALDLETIPTPLVVEVGCGSGAYTRLIARALPTGGRVVGMDLDLRLAAAALRIAASEGLEDRMAFVTGDSLRLPLSDRCADRAFCNTLLWLLADPLAAVKEMARVVRPSGLVVASEPDAGLAVYYDPQDPRLAQLALRSIQAFTRGARLLWGQDFEIGRRLPELFRVAGLVNVRVFPRFWIDLDSDFEAEPAESRLASYRWQLARLEAEEDETDLEPPEDPAPETRPRLERWEQARLAGGMTAAELAEYRERRRGRLRSLIEDPERLASDVAVRTWGGVIARGRRP